MSTYTGRHYAYAEPESLIGAAPAGMVALRHTVARGLPTVPGAEVGRYEGVTFHERGLPLVPLKDID